MKSARRCVLAALAAVVMVTGVPGAFAQSGAPVEKVTIAMGGKSLYYLPLAIAVKRGYFRREGIDASVVDFLGGSKAVEAAIGGSADMAAASYEYTITMQPKHVSLIGVVLMGRYSGMALAIAKRHEAAYRTPKDLKSMTIGITAPGSSTNMFLNNILVKNGLKPGDVSVIGVGTTSAAVAAMRQGTIDAIVNLDPVITQLETDGSAKVVADARTDTGMEEVYGGPYLAGCMLVSPEYIGSHPQAVQRVVNAVVHALQWIHHATPDQIVDTVGPEYYGNNKALFKTSLEKNLGSFMGDGTFSTDGAQNVYQVLDRFVPAVHGGSVDLQKTYTNRFAEQALKQYH